MWCKIKEIYHAAILEACARGILMLSAHRGVVTLIPKKDRDPLWLKNWRPLTMLNCNYKILAKALATRMLRVLPEIIDIDQTGFMKGRNIAANIRRTIEVIEYTKKHQIPAILMSVDFEKCFDLIEHASVWAAMEQFNFGKQYINYVKLLFNNFESCIQSNGHISEFFPIQRSVHQGSPISAFLQLICAQVMTYLIKSNSTIKPIDIYGIKQVICQFADDTDLFLHFEQQTLDEVFKIFLALERNIGFKINYDKTTLYRIGSIANSNARLYTEREVQWTNDPVNVLGVLVSNNTTELYSENFENICTKTDAVLRSWAHRSLTLTG